MTHTISQRYQWFKVHLWMAVVNVLFRFLAGVVLGVAIAVIINLFRLPGVAIFSWPLMVGMTLCRSWTSATAAGVTIGGILGADHALGLTADVPPKDVVVFLSLMVTSSAAVAALGRGIGQLAIYLRANGKDALAGGISIALAPLMLAPALGFFHALWADARAGKTAMFALDLVFPPFGMIRGILLWLGLL